MIALLKGLIAVIGDNNVILDVNGVGYLVYASSKTLSRIGGRGEAAMLHIETHVREDHIHLYGFASHEEKDWFTILCTVQGVGAKMALSLLSTVDADRIASVIASEDKAALTAADGVGPKLALRIITELKEKAAKMAFPSGVVSIADAKGKKSAAQKSEPNNSADAVSALTHLGYNRVDAFTAVAKVANEYGQQTGLQDLIRLSLKELSA